MYNRFGDRIANTLEQQKLHSSIEQIQKMQIQLEREYLNNRQPPIINQNNPEEQYNKNVSQYKQKYGNYDQNYEDYQPRFNAVGRNSLDYQIPFVGSTTYNEHYTKPTSAVAQRLNPQLNYASMLRPELPTYPDYSRIKFEGESTYKASYGDLEAMDSIRLINSEKINRKQLHNPIIGKFYGSTSYKDSYAPFRYEMRKDRILESQLPKKDAKFQGDSTYHNDYKNFKVENRKYSNCDVDYLPVPYRNNLNNKDHIRYDAISNKFV